MCGGWSLFWDAVYLSSTEIFAVIKSPNISYHIPNKPWDCHVCLHTRKHTRQRIKAESMRWKERQELTGQYGYNRGAMPSSSLQASPPKLKSGL